MTIEEFGYFIEQIAKYLDVEDDEVAEALVEYFGDRVNPNPGLEIKIDKLKLKYNL